MLRFGPFLLLLLVFGLLAAVYSLSTPLFEAPDELWHYAYVRWLAEGHGLPRLDDGASGAYQEVAQPPFYYAVAALVSSPVADDDLPELLWHNPQFGYQAGGTVNDNKNMLIHTDRERFPWHGAVLSVHLARLVSLVFGLLTVGATYGLAREALPERPALAMVAAGAVAFTPQFLFISGVVSNDSATAATCTCVLWVLGRIIRLGPTPRRATVAGLVLGLALLSKTSALLLLPIALLALGMGRLERGAALRLRSGCSLRLYPGSRAKGREARDVWRGAVLMLSLAGAVGGWWYLRNWILFDDPLGLKVHINTPWGRTTPVSLAALLPELSQVFRSFWGAFGWGHVELPGPLYAALGGLVGLALVGWMRHLVRLGRAPLRQVLRQHPERSGGQDADAIRRFALDAGAESSRRSARGTAPVIAGTCILAALWCLAVLMALLRWMQQVGAPHGRLLFPALGAWGLLLAVGWSGLSPNRHPSLVTRYSSLAPIAGLLALSLVVPFAIIQPAFARPRLLSPQAAAANVTPYTLNYDGQARLLGYRVEPESVAAGGRIEVTLCWEALRPMTQDYTLFIHLLGHENLRVAERTTYPGQGRFPTSLWTMGRAFCESYRLEVAPWAPAPELYALEVGLYDFETGWRLPVQDTSGQTVVLPAVDLVRVTSVAPSPRPAYPLSYNLGEQIALVGYDVREPFGQSLRTKPQTSAADRSRSDSVEPPNDGPTTPDPLRSAASSDTLTLTLYWQALQVPQGDYKVFVHLLDESGELVTQDDAPPRGGRYPTWAWRPGDLVPDLHQLALPDERSPGPYHWSVGMYRIDTKERLPVTGPKGPVPDRAIPLGEIWDSVIRYP